MKLIYKLAEAAFEKMDSKNPTAPQGKVFQMGFMDGYLAGFREARSQAALIASYEEGLFFGIDKLGEQDDFDPRLTQRGNCGAV